MVRRLRPTPRDRDSAIGGPTVRFADINDISSPSATALGIAFVTRNADRWTLDDKLGADPRFDAVPKTIPALRKVLSK